MYFSKLAHLLPLISSIILAQAQDTNLTTVKDAFDSANISATINFPFNPEALLEVTFPQTSGQNITLQAGMQVAQNATAIPPIFAISGLGSSSKGDGNSSVGSGPFVGPFVVAMIDPDAPTPQNPNASDIRHFLGGDFYASSADSGSDSSALTLTNNTPAVSEFVQPNPPAISDAHRYIFLLFRQSPDFNNQTLINATTSVNDIINFNLSSFALAENLGSPIAGTFMRLGPDANTTSVANGTSTSSKASATSGAIRMSFIGHTWGKKIVRLAFRFALHK